ncbi:MAG: S-layer homology domain-containing protein [Bacillota bacterium]|nr:S-layer homology domain-containing protein [Bacillota bacterium]
MKFKKHYKLASLILISFIILLPLNSIADESFEEAAANNLVSLNIMQGYSDGQLRLQNKINRSEFTTLVVKMMGYDKDTDTDNIKLDFKDVLKKNWAYVFIKAAVKNKLVMGNNEKEFRPTSNITYAEALTVMIRALGYEKTLDGKWPDNVLKKASELGVDKNLSLEKDDQITRGQMSIIIDNSLSVDTNGF